MLPSLEIFEGRQVDNEGRWEAWEGVRKVLQGRKGTDEETRLDSRPTAGNQMEKNSVSEEGMGNF